MKAYLVTTGILFGLLSVLHVWRAIAEWPRPAVDPGFLLQIVVTVALPGVLSWWAWRLLRNLSGNRTKGENEKMQRKDSDDPAA
jgi:tetrahydromethanopterin S-methyltransferase subunit E